MVKIKRTSAAVFLALGIAAVTRLTVPADQSTAAAVEQNPATSIREQLPGGDYPEIFVGLQNYDAGEVWEGDEIVHAFTVENRGTAQLTIAKVQPG